MATQRSIEIIHRRLPDVEIVADEAPAHDAVRRSVPLTKQPALRQLRAASLESGASTTRLRAGGKVASRLGGSELVKVKVVKGVRADRKPRTYTVVVSGDKDEIVGSQG